MHSCHLYRQQAVYACTWTVTSSFFAAIFLASHIFGSWVFSLLFWSPPSVRLAVLLEIGLSEISKYWMINHYTITPQNILWVTSEMPQWEKLIVSHLKMCTRCGMYCVLTCYWTFENKSCRICWRLNVSNDIIEYTLKQKWKWAGHIARLKDNRWTRRCTEWQPRRGKRSRGRPSRRWQDDITEKEGTTWIRKATDRRRWKTLMEGYILQWMDKA